MFKMVIKWLLERYGKEEAVRIWRKTRKTYNSWLFDLPDYGLFLLPFPGGYVSYSFSSNIPDSAIVLIAVTAISYETGSSRIREVIVS